MSRRTGIIGTLGPISETRACIDGLVAAGLDTVRLSMSNGTRERHRATARRVREIASERARQVTLLADLQGRKNRLGRFPDGGAEWAIGEEVHLTAEPGSLDTHRTWTTYRWDAELTQTGAAVFIDDGAIVLSVQEVRHDELRCVVVNGGSVTDGRGVTLPGGTVYPPGLTDRDVDDLMFARDLGVEAVALSFAEQAEDCHAVRALAPDVAIIGKVESPAAMRHLPALADAFDGLMVARGDLSLEIPFEDVPAAQEAVLDACIRRGKQSMVATHVLHSMRVHVRPTPAEVADVAMAVRSGAGGLLLTGETGYGRHPVHVVDVLRRLIERAERDWPPVHR
ncbi:pyruvate kinase [Micromonospora sp. DT228]|uniref:pyruvate kinase n=1 Tax=Micromonospora sp. DT228 TaxID=3393443 RepID=UPI003CED869A